MNAFNKQKFEAELEYYIRQLSDAAQQLSQKHEWNQAYEDFAIFEISVCAEIFAFVHEQLVTLNVTDITKYETDVAVIAEYLKKSESIRKPGSPIHMDSASFETFCEATAGIFCETINRHKNDCEIDFSELKRELIAANCNSGGADEDPELLTVLFFCEYIIETVILAYRLYVNQRKRYTTEQFLGRPNEMYSLIIEAQKRIRRNHKFLFCTSVGILCWFEMDDKQFNLDATVNGKKLMCGQFLEDESIKVHYWLGGDFWLGSSGKALEFSTSNKPLTPDVILTADTTEETAIDALGEHLYHEFVFNFEELLKKYEPPNEHELENNDNNALPQAFLELLQDYADLRVDISQIHGDTYLWRLAEKGLADLDSLCDAIDYIMFTNHAVMSPKMFEQYNLNEIVEFIAQRSFFGSAIRE